jgi:hypothetical protein
MGEQVTGIMGDKAKARTAAETVAKVRGVAAQPRVKRDHVKITHMFTRDQAEWLREEAYSRARAKGSRKPDESEIIREAVDWFREEYERNPDAIEGWIISRGGFSEGEER